MNHFDQHAFSFEDIDDTAATADGSHVAQRAVPPAGSSERAPRGKLVEVTLAKFEDLKSRLDSGEARLRRGYNGKCDLQHAMKLAGASTSAHARHLEVKTAFEELVKDRQLDEPPPKDRRPYARAAEYLKRLQKLSTRLNSGQTTLRRDANGQLDRENVAQLAGLQPGWDRHERVIKAIDQLAAEYPEALPDPVDEEEGLRVLDAYDLKLHFDGERVPSLLGHPSVGLAAPAIGLPARAITTSKRLLERFKAIAVRHGVAAPAKDGGKEGLVYLAQRKLRDEFDTAVLRGTDFPTLASGNLDHQALFTQCGLPCDLVIQTKVRASMTAFHRKIRDALGKDPVSAEQSQLGNAHAVIDRYELHVMAGAEPVPTKADGSIDIARVEHRYQLVLGTSKRFPEIGDRIAAIAAAKGAEADRARAEMSLAVIQSVTLHGAMLLAQKQRFACDVNGNASHSVIEQAMYLRSGTIALYDDAKAVAAEIAESVGKRLVGHDWSKDRVAPLIDRYIVHIKERGHRWPRVTAVADEMSKSGIAREIAELTGEPVAVEELTIHWVHRIRYSCRHVPKPGAVEYREARKSNLSAPRPSLDVLKKAMERFKDGIPADPLDDRIYDLCEIAEAAWIDVRTLMNTPEYMACIDGCHRDFGLKPFSHQAAMITIQQLIERGRQRRAVETGSARPGEAVARTVRALIDAMTCSGLSTSDDAARIPEMSACGAGEAGSGSQLGRWRRYLGELRREAMLPDGFARSLKVLLRTASMMPRDLQRRLEEMSNVPINRDMIYNWALGLKEPSYAQQHIVDLIEEFFELEKGVLTSKICADHRMRGPYELGPDGIPIPKGFDAHLPFNYPDLARDEQHRLLNYVTDEIFTQNTEHSLRHRVVSIDKYRLKVERWPEHLKNEWRAYLKTRVASDDMEIGADIDEDPDGDDAKPLTAGSGARITGHLEGFFGFLTRPASPGGSFTGVRENTPDWRRERAEELAQAADYTPMPGLGIPLEHLSIGAIVVRDFYRAYVRFIKERSGDDSRDSLNVVNFFLTLVDVGGFVRGDEDMHARTAGMLDWWQAEQCLDLRRKFNKLGTIGQDTSGWEDACENAAILYRRRYVALCDRLHGRKNQKRLAKLRDPFAPIRKILTSKWPRRYYRKAIQRMISARPTQIRMRHVWLRDCILALILFRTLLRIKNLTRLTYRPDNTGQLRREGKTWVVQIHKENFKNKSGSYFIGGDYFRMTLNDDDGLYEMLDQYIGITRQHFLGRRGEEKNEDEDEAAVLAEANGRDGFFDDLADFDDGEADEDRFFLNADGDPFSPPYLSARYYAITKRHFVHNRYRRRGMRGFMPHGPHCVRHIGATAVLKRGGTYAQAGRVIQDSEESARKNYVEWGPADSGANAGTLLDTCD